MNKDVYIQSLVIRISLKKRAGPERWRAGLKTGRAIGPVQGSMQQQPRQ